MAKVSFIMPAYKRRFLRMAIESILAQTYQDFELVVVDDCSPEDLRSVVEEFDDERVTYHRHDQNLGGKDLIAAWNSAMRYATGDWCVLAGDDDLYSPRFLDELLASVNKYPRCDLHHARSYTINADNVRIDVAEPFHEWESQIEFSFNRGARLFQTRAPDFLFRRSAFERLGGFVRFPLAWYSDDATWMLLAKNGVGCPRDVLFSFRMSPINISSLHTNVRQKIAAGEQFKKWFVCFCEKLQPCTEEECALLTLLVPRVLNRVDGLAKSEMRHLGIGEWCRCYAIISGSSISRRTFLYDRFPLFAWARSLI